MADQNLDDEDKGTSDELVELSGANSGSTTAGKAGTSNATTGQGKPSIKPNALSNYSSYTYNLSLYMITPDAFNEFEAGGRKNLNSFLAGQGSNVQGAGGAYLILQSGGINKEVSPRSPGFELDYYIDDLKIKSIIAPSENSATTVQTTFTFNIIEPYGFSFLNKLRIAGDNIVKYSKTINIKEQKNPSRQLFILGIKFVGYDKNGKVLQTNGEESGVFETYYPIIISNISFKIDGKTTVYNIKAFSLGPQESFTLKRGRLNKEMTITARTVDEALNGKNGLIEQLNAYHKSLDYGKDGQPINTFKLEYAGNFDKTAVLNLPTNNNKQHWSFSQAKKAGEVNEATSQKTRPDDTKRVISFRSGTSIIQVVEGIFKQSTYLTDALNTVYNQVAEPDEEKKDYSEEPNEKPPAKVSWYNLSSKVKVKGYNKNINDFVYDITYVISPYETPVLLNVYSNNLQKYYGPVKRYEYWFTGQNSEVINYEQTNNNGYFIVALDAGKNTTVNSGGANTPINPNMPQNADVSGQEGISQQAQAAYLTNLFDPKSYSQAKITILGDPDFLMHDTLTDKALAVYNQFYDYNPTRVNPLGGQVFIEMNFKEAVDYNNSKGTMTINDQIVFWQYPQKIKDIVKGVSFLVKWVESTFSKGRFTQDLLCTVNTFSGDDKTWKKDENSTSEEQRAETQQPQSREQGSDTNSPNKSTGGTANDTGFKQVPTSQQNATPTSFDTDGNIIPSDAENENAGKTTAPVEEGGRE